MSSQTPKPVTRTISREARVVLRFVETISETYSEPTPSRPSVFPPAKPGLVRCATVHPIRRTGTR